MQFMLQRVKQATNKINARGLKQSSSETTVTVVTFDNKPLHQPTINILSTYWLIKYIMQVTGPQTTAY